MGLQTGRGAKFGFATITSGVVGSYTDVAYVISIDGPGITVGEVEGTLLSSLFKPYSPTIPEGEGSATLQYDNTNAAIGTLRDAVAVAPVPIYGFQITWQDGQKTTFQGFLKSFKVANVENESRVTADIDFRMTTSPVTGP